MKTVLFILLSFISTTSFGQLSERDSEKADFLIENFRNHTDSSRQLTNSASIDYISDSLFKAIILTLGNGDKIVLDIRYKDNSQGYTELGADFVNYVLIKHRGQGSENPEQLRVINKKNGDDKWLGDYPFYLDTKNEIGVYETLINSFSKIVIHNFSTDKTEFYPTPDTICSCCDCFEIIEFNDKFFTVRYSDLENNTTEQRIERKE
ncbi:hypothetical protein J0A68_04905 [Algoriphagus sp. H41]|uniref:Uncharacterized protein n=1 Tax=Algoriphagus oliviformis TaxID=2811231 RepID=A0ABS3C0Y7_9BACT|nr:hypothetical protein [Algoriphagus oliviformis]MBN7810284.1 hypothetical protein [Algoriphagus oliviformis]